MRGSAATRLLGLRFRIPPGGTWMSVSCECWLLSNRGLCVGLITSKEEGVPPSVVRLSMIVKPRQLGDRGPLEAVAVWKRNF